MMPVRPDGPISLAVLNDHEVVTRGVAAMLAPFEGRVCVVELDHGLYLGRRVDIALYNAYALPARGLGELDLRTHGNMARHTVLYTWRITDQVIALAEARRMSGVLAKTLSARALVDALEQIYAGRRVVAQPADDTDDLGEGGDWPGRAEGLTPRQSEIIALIVAGINNREIAESCYLSPNSVKSYIRTAYQTMGVTSRSEAILWGIDHGFRRTSRTRLVLRQDDSGAFDEAPVAAPRADVPRAGGLTPVGSAEGSSAASHADERDVTPGLSS